MRSLVPAAILICLALSCSAARAEDAPCGPDAHNSDESTGDANSANDPTSPKLTLEYWNFYAPSLYGYGGEAENGLGRILITFKVDGVQQFLHVLPPVSGDPLATTGPHTGLASTQIYILMLERYDVGLPEKVTFGLGPLIAPPSDTSTNFGPSRWQAGVAGVVIALQSWGLVGVLATYQHTLTGSRSQYTTAQPNICYNLKDDYYLRCSAIIEVQHARSLDADPDRPRGRQGHPARRRLHAERLRGGAAHRLPQRARHTRLRAINRHRAPVPIVHYRKPQLQHAPVQLRLERRLRPD